MHINKIPSFGSVYKVELTSELCGKKEKNAYDLSEALNKEFKLTDKPNQIRQYIEFSGSIDDMYKGKFGTITYISPNRFDPMIEAYLKYSNINFQKIQKKELLDLYNIKTRMKLGNYDKSQNYKLIELDVNKIDKIYAVTEGGWQYILPNQKINNIQKQLYTETILKGGDLEAPHISIQEDLLGEPQVFFLRNREEYAILRDKGMKSLPFVLDNKSLALAIKHNLISYSTEIN